MVTVDLIWTPTFTGMKGMSDEKLIYYKNPIFNTSKSYDSVLFDTKYVFLLLTEILSKYTGLEWYLIKTKDPNVTDILD